MHTLGYEFKPWVADKAIADGPSILDYVRETATENGIEEHIRYRHHVTTAEWSSNAAAWTVNVHRTDTGEPTQFTCNFLYMCAGYYSYKGGYAPTFPGQENFEGTLVHPQAWPQDLDYAGRRIAIIGSGATAVTLLPAMADDAAHVTMVQRTPSYVVAWPEKDRIANALRAILPAKTAYRLTRWKNITLQQFVYRQSRVRTAFMRNKLLKMVRKQLGPDFDVDTHLTPTYNPWDQRLCLAPDGDFFTALYSGQASIATGHIETFTAEGIRLQSGQEIPADIIVTATGLHLVLLGEVQFKVDGRPVDFSQTYSYKGFAYSGVPNLCASFGYVNASWTLRSDLIAAYVCRLLNHMDDLGARQCTPRLRADDMEMTPRPFIDDFNPGYMARVQDMFPKQGDRAPWLNPQNYAADKTRLLKAPVDDGVMQFTTPENSL